jgi:hypothetical protein
VRAAQKVRLVHAAVRHHLAGEPGFEGEIPMNQEDLLGTLFCFSIVTMDAAYQLGAALAPEDAEAYLHLWCVIGALLGIDEARLPRSVAEARALAARVAERQVRASEAGRVLTRALLVAMERHMPSPLLEPVPRWLVRELAGRELAELLGVPPAGPLDGRALGLLRSHAILGRAARGVMAAVSSIVGRQLIEGLVSMKLGGRRPAFPMPVAAPAPRGAISGRRPRGSIRS